ncbi:hypothetical protein FACS1894193_13640 [Bacilli bacterium]|nr:hypothetical protein FACS1894192_04820 [Bacilli bacterium]GHU44821.1 hypothetical protein FACS1894193_13640 [Bacilli bacterium]
MLTKKTSLLNILTLLKRETNFNHTLTVKQIGDILEKNYDQKLDRKSIKRNLNELIEMGYDINYEETSRRNADPVQTDWYINPEFDDSELRFLIDSVTFAKNIPPRQKTEMTTKLEKLTSRHFKSSRSKILQFEHTRPETAEFLLNIDILNEAIESQKQISFHYLDIGMDKKLYPKLRSDKTTIRDYRLSPYLLTMVNTQTYLVGQHDRYDNVTTYRVDRMTNVKILENEPAKLAEFDYNLPKHYAEHIYMHSGESIHATFLVDEWLLTTVMDWFGGGVSLNRAEDGRVKVKVRVNRQAMFYWAMQFSKFCEVIGRLDLREELCQAFRDNLEKYTK